MALPTTTFRVSERSTLEQPVQESPIVSTLCSNQTLIIINPRARTQSDNVARGNKLCPRSHTNLRLFPAHGFSVLGQIDFERLPSAKKKICAPHHKKICSSGEKIRPSTKRFLFIYKYPNNNQEMRKIKESAVLSKDVEGHRSK